MTIATNENNRIMDYINRHPETAEFVLTLESKAAHKSGDIFYERVRKAPTITEIRKVHNTSPKITVRIFNGAPMYIICGNGKMFCIPMGWITPISVEHREFDTQSKHQEVILKYSYDDAIHTLKVCFD